MTLHKRALSTEIGSDPPTEFRIFTKGVNDSEQGPALFDSQAALDVMTAWKTWGVDLMIDLNHYSLDADDKSDPEAADARGWFRPEVRDGELWAVGVTWTADGEARLRDRRQRYISPAFFTEQLPDGQERVKELLNVALVAMPATHKAPPLVASRRFSLSLRQYEEALGKAVQSKYGSDDPKSYTYIADAYSDRIIFDRDGTLYSVAYTANGNEVLLTGEPIEVVRTYMPVDVAARVRAAKLIARARAKLKRS